MTDLIKWRPEFGLGIDEIDHEHRELIDLINQLYGSVHDGAGDDVVQVFLGEVYARIAAHFALEERIMQTAGYEEYAAHKADHEHLLDDILDIMDAAGTGFEADAFSTRLGAWFATHFQTFDARLHLKHG